MKKALLLFILIIMSCSSQRTIVHGVDEGDANRMLVLLNSKNINAQKVQSSEGGGAGANKTVLWDIVVPQDQAIDAMNELSDAGLPRPHGESLLDIFSNTGLVPSEQSEIVRYQAGLAQQIAGTIRKMDGVLDADVVISYPKEDVLNPDKKTGAITASVYVKHNGTLDDPNLHLDTKIKQLVSSSVTGLSFDDVTVIGDRANIPETGNFQNQPANQEVAVWSVDVNENSVFRFRVIFFSLLTLVLLLILSLIWLTYKLNPLIQKLGLKRLFDTHPITFDKEEVKETKIEEKTEEPKKNDEDVT